MKPSTNRVYALLKRNASKGVSCRDFPNGFNLKGRVHELRAWHGISINTTMTNGIGVFRLI